MDISSDIKNKYFALGATVGVHILLLCILVFNLLEKPNRASMPSLNTAEGKGLEINYILESNTTNISKTNSSSHQSATVSSKKEDCLTTSVTNPNETSISANKNSENNSNDFKIDANLKYALSLLSKKSGSKTSENQGNLNDITGNLKKQNLGIVAEQTPTSFYLNNRKLMHPPSVLTDTKEEGIVVVEIIVDEIGNVIKAIPGQRGSTTISSSLYSKARQEAYQAKFNPSPEGIIEQRGTYIFVFNLE
jgi:hypothetical protein